MAAKGYALFDTAIGTCGIAWSERGVVSVQLPEVSTSATLSRLRERFPKAARLDPPDKVQNAIERICALLEGQKIELASIELDYEGIPPFSRQVYELARRIPVGCTLSYGDIATRLGSPHAARAVGQALGRNPWALVVPCHRVLAATGKLTGFSAHGGVSTKRRLLAIESAHVAS